jgi:hypothetical protein
MRGCILRHRLGDKKQQQIGSPTVLCVMVPVKTGADWRSMMLPHAKRGGCRMGKGQGIK